MKKLNIVLFLSMFFVSIVVTFSAPVDAATKQSNARGYGRTENSISGDYCGIWEYDENGAKDYLKITKDGPDRYKFTKGYKYQGSIVWQKFMLTNAKDIYLKPSNGKLVGRFVSANFYATHGEDYTYQITLDIKPDKKMLYSVWNSINKKTEAREATKISD